MRRDALRNLFTTSKIAPRYAMGRAEEAVDRGCIGRITGLIVLVTMVACVGSWGAAYYLANRSGALAVIPEQISGPVIGITLIGGLSSASSAARSGGRCGGAWGALAIMLGWTAATAVVIVRANPQLLDGPRAKHSASRAAPGTAEPHPNASPVLGGAGVAMAKQTG